MSFRFYSNMLSSALGWLTPHASRRISGWFFTAGLLMIGLAFLIWILRELFALLFAAIFASVGVASIVISIKMFWTQHRFRKTARDDSEGYRQNVRIHIEDNYQQ